MWSAGYYTSECSDSTRGESGCNCEDDGTAGVHRVRSGHLLGRGSEPRLYVPAVPLEDVLPELKFRWGGNEFREPEATGRPFEASAQLMTTPIVTIWTNDNDDGGVNELDFRNHSHDGRRHAGGRVVRAFTGAAEQGRGLFRAVRRRSIVRGGRPGGRVRRRECTPGGVLAAGDLDNDEFPEIRRGRSTSVVCSFSNHRGRIVAPRAGSARQRALVLPGPRHRANLDFAGLAEIVFRQSRDTLASKGRSSCSTGSSWAWARTAPRT